MTTAETIKDLISRKDALHRYLNIDTLKTQIAEEEQKTEAPDFWNDPKEAQKVMKTIQTKKSWVNAFNEVESSCGDLQVLGEFFDSGDATEDEVIEQINITQPLVEALELKNMLQGESDRFDAVLSINAGAGGVEAQDWAEMLMRMYIRYAETHHYRVAISNSLDGEGAGIKSVTMQIEGEYAFGYSRIPSARNQQVLRMRLVTHDSGADRVLPLVKMGAALPELHLPFPGTEPEAFIIVCSTVEENPMVDIDLGIAAQSMLLKAVEMGFNGLIIAAFNRAKLQETLALPYTPLLVLAIGKGDERIELTPIGEEESHAYYRKDGVHYVPKVRMTDLIIKE